MSDADIVTEVSLRLNYALTIDGLQEFIDATRAIDIPGETTLGMDLSRTNGIEGGSPVPLLIARKP